MALVSVPVFEVSVKQTYLGKVVYNVLHYVQDSGNVEVAGFTVDQPFLAAFAESWEETWIPLQNVALTLNEYKLRVADQFRVTHTDDDPPQTRNRLLFLREAVRTADSVAGTVTGDALNSFTAAHGYKQTSFFGRKSRGSLHICGLSESQVVGQSLGVAASVDFNNSFVAFLPLPFSVVVDTVTFDFLPVVWSTRRDLRNDVGDYNLGPTDVRAVISGAFNNRLGSMTRRKLRA